MKKILITGAASYIGTYVERYLAQWPEAYLVDTIGMVDGNWRTASLQGYDAVLHVAGLVHQSKTKEDPAQWAHYKQVNTDLAIETAQKAKADGVGQFLFLSSASVYGLTAPLGQTVVITRNTPLNPTDNYGRSKMLAERGLEELETDDFRVAILRPPMIYGRGCKGNYVTLAKLACKLPLFPKVKNQRSMLYMENLANFVKLLLDDQARGIFCPQNDEYVNTSDMVQKIAQAHGRHLLLVPGFTWSLHGLRHVTAMVDKAFGSLCYDRDLSCYHRDYCVKNLEESILETEGVR